MSTENFKCRFLSNFKKYKNKVLGATCKINQDTLKSQHHVKRGTYIYYCYKQEYIDKTALKHPAIYVSQSY